MIATNLSFSRQTLISELHSRPFIAMMPGARVSYLAIMHTADNKHQNAFEDFRLACKKIGFDAPDKPSSYHLLEKDNIILKWENHSEFASFLLYQAKQKKVTFDGGGFDTFPEEFLALYKERIISAVEIEIPTVDKTPLDKCIELYRPFFVVSSLAVAAVLEEAAVIASDFHMDENGNVRFLLIPRAKIGARRLGRIVQRLVEIETYKTASMLALPMARNIARELPAMETRLPELIGNISKENSDANLALHELLALSSQVETSIAQSTFRFSAAEAYSGIVQQRVSVLRESRVGGFQLFSEFMLRRYEPGMRTVQSSWSRLKNFSKRLERSADLLRTHVDVKNAENQRELLASMNRRSAMQLRLQETVEGFSIVAISYYAVSLASYLLAPLAKNLNVEKAWIMAVAVPIVVLLVWMFVRRIKGHVNKE